MNWIQGSQPRNIMLKINRTADNEIRRVKFDNPTHANLLKMVNADKKVELSYRDYENDWVRFDTEEEWNEALKIYKYILEKNPTAALSVKVVTVEEKEQEPIMMEEIEEAVNMLVVDPPVLSQAVEVQDDEDTLSEDLSEISDAPLLSADAPIDSEESEEDKALRQSMQAMRQSVSNFMQNAPQPAVDRIELPSSQLEEVKTERKFPEQLKLLAEMGFGEETKNVELLEKFNGDVGQVIQVYLS